jgi:hypothetical protein
MANNLFVNYDLIKTKDYPAVHEAIKSLGNWAKVTESNWYVNSNYSATQALEIIRKKTDSDDKLIIIDTTNNAVAWVNLPSEVEEHIKSNWHR